MTLWHLEKGSPCYMHLAIRDVGVIYASAICHAGWDEGDGLPPARREGWTIPYRKAEPGDGGHAFAIVGYDAHGFLILNSWGDRWGDDGLATLPTGTGSTTPWTSPSSGSSLTSTRPSAAR